MNAAMGPPVGMAADLWGRKWFLVIFAALGVVGSMMVARAHSIALVIAGFTVLGIHVGCQPILYAVVSEVLPRKHRPYAQASINVAAGIGGVIALTMGGALLRHGNYANFRIYFYVTAGLFAVACIGVALFYNPPPREAEVTQANSKKLRQVDWIGTFLFVSGLILLCMGLSWSENPYSWRNAHILAPFVLGVVVLVLFGIYEWLLKKDGMLHHGLFQSRNFPIALILVFVEGATFFTTNQYFAYEVGIFLGTDLLMSGLHFAITFIAGTVACLIMAAYSSRWKVLRTPILIGYTSLLLFNILMAVAKPTTPINNFWGYPVFAGLGLASILPPIMVAAQLSTPPELISLVSGLIVAGRSVGGTIGLAINSAILNSALKMEIPKKIAAAALPLGLPTTSLGPLIEAFTADNQAAIAAIPGIDPDIIVVSVAALKEAYGIGFRRCWITAACFCALAILGE
jgi:MFS family permease